MDEIEDSESINWSCNIGRTGRVVRGTIGLACLGIGIWLLLTDRAAFWATGLCAIGAFAIFEALKGWCAIRAIGMRTPF